MSWCVGASEQGIIATYGKPEWVTLTVLSKTTSYKEYFGGSLVSSPTSYECPIGGDYSVKIETNRYQSILEVSSMRARRILVKMSSKKRIFSVERCDDTDEDKLILIVALEEPGKDHFIKLQIETDRDEIDRIVKRKAQRRAKRFPIANPKALGSNK